MWKQGYRVSTPNLGVPNSRCYLKILGPRVLDSGSFKSHWGLGFQVLGSTLPECNIISNQPNNSTLADKIESNQHNAALARSSVFKPIKRRGGGEVILARKTFNTSKMINATVPDFVPFIIYLFERFCENFILLPFIILEIFIISETDIFPTSFH